MAGRVAAHRKPIARWYGLCNSAAIPAVRSAKSLRAVSSASLLALSVAGTTACVRTVAAPGGLPSDDAPIVGDVTIAGNDDVSDDDIVDGLALRPPTGFFTIVRTRFDPVALELDRRRVVAYYQSRGYFDARVTDVSTAPADGDRVAITFQVEEGPRTSVAKLAVAGAAGLEGIGRDELLEVTGVDIGEPLVYEEYEEAQARVKSHLVSKGYAFADVGGQIEIAREEASAGVFFLVDAGPRVRFGDTIVVGNDMVPTETILARVAWDEGEIFDPELIEETRTLLYELGLFGVVRFDLDDENRPEVADVEIFLAESRRHEVRLGAGAGIDRTRYEVRLRAGYTERGFILPLMTLRLEARPAYFFLRDSSATAIDGLGGEASAALDLDDFLLPRLSLGNLLAYSDSDFQAYSIRGPRFRISLQRPFFGDDLRLAAAWSIRSQTFTRVDAGIDEMQRAELGITEDRYRLGLFDQSIVLDLRDNPLDAHDGIYAELRLEESGAYAGSAFDYVRVMPELRGYFSPFQRLVLAARARYGRTLFGPDLLPITQRFYAGGASSHRGFSFQRLSPMITSEEGGTLPVGGEELVETSIEARVDVARLWENWLGIAVFLDGGDVVADPGALELTNLHWAVGTGLRYHTLIGPLRVDVGYRLNRKGSGEPDAGNAFAFHLSLGEAF